MATERNYNAVPPILLTSNGSTDGILQVTDTAGFYVQMQATLANNLNNKLTVYIKRVVDSTTLWVGATKGGMDHNVDVSAFTTATSSTISAQEQNKQTVPMEAKLLATYENDPIDAWRTIPVDSYGNKYTTSNTFPINIVPSTKIPFTLGALTLPTLISSYANSLTYTEVTSDSIGTEEVLTFYNGGTVVGEVNITQSPDGWILNFGALGNGFLLLENGAFFALEDDSGTILLE